MTLYKLENVSKTYQLGNEPTHALNKIDLNKDYFSLNLIKSTGASSIKIWISYK